MPDEKYDKQDQITAFLFKAINALFINSPQKTALGVLLGGFLCGTVNIIFQLFEVTLEISIWFFLCFGVLLVHFPSLFKKHRIDEELETKMHYLEEAQKKGDFTQAEKRDQWKKFTTLIYDKIGEPQDDANQSKFDEKKEQNNAAPAK